MLERLFERVEQLDDRMEALALGAGEEGANVGGVQVAPAEAVNGAAELAPAAVERGRHLGLERRRGAGRVGAVEDDDEVDAAQGCRDRRGGERSERGQLEQADGLALLAQLVDDVLDRSRRRAEGDDRCAGALEPVLLDLAVAAAAELGELGSELAERGRRGLDRGRLLAAELVLVVRHRERPLRGRARDVEHVIRDRVVADEVPDRRVREQRDGLGGMRDREPVLADEHR